MALIGRFQYPGLPPEAVQFASYSLGHGVTPGVITVEVPAGQHFPAQEGTGVFSFGAVSIVILNCKFDIGTSRIGQGQMWTFAILDGRWPFQFGDITGHYNLRKPDGSIKTETEKTPQELAKLCLQRMFIGRYDFSRMENTRRPEIHWSYANPAQSLAALADEVGCRVVYEVDRFVRILPAGDGASLPNLPATSLDFSFDTAQIPAGITIVGPESLFQSRWELEAVGRDTDGKWKPIDELDYMPSGGWEEEDPDKMSNVEERNDHDKDNPRKLALQTVFRSYRIKALKGSGRFPGFTGRVTDYKKCLPLSDGLIDIQQNDGAVDGMERKPKPPIVRGDWHDNEYLYEDLENKQYKGQFSVDGQNGIIQFNRAVYRLDGGRYKPADFVVEIAFPIRSDVREPHRPTWRFPLSGRSGVGDKILQAEDLKYTAKILFDSDDTETGSENNRRDDRLDEQARDAANVFLQSLTTVQAGDRTYPGLFDIHPDGAISQISWSIGRGICTTRVSRNTEHDSDIIPPYKDRRRKEKAAQEDADFKKVQKRFYNKDFEA